MKTVHWTVQSNSKKHTHYICNLNKIKPVFENSLHRSYHRRGRSMLKLIRVTVCDKGEVIFHVGVTPRSRSKWQIPKNWQWRQAANQNVQWDLYTRSIWNNACLIAFFYPWISRNYIKPGVTKIHETPCTCLITYSKQ